MNILSVNQNGASRLTLLLALVTVGGIVYFGFPIVGFYYNNAEIEGLIEYQAKTAAARTQDQTRKVILDKMRKLEIPAIKEKLVVEYGYDEVRIALDYEEVLDLDLTEVLGDEYYWEIHTFYFDIEEVQSMVPRP